MPRSAENLIGKKFGRLTVINRAETDKKGVWWNCKCECGNEKIIDKAPLLRGDINSCGCLKMSKGELKISSLLEKK